MLSELLALQVMLPNQVIFGFHRDAERGWRGAELWETPPTKDLEAQLYLVRFRILSCSPDACLPREAKPTRSPGSKPGDGVVNWCLAQSRACSGAGAQPMGGTKLGLISYEVGGSLHVRGMEMAWTGLRQLWGTGRKEGFFTSSRTSQVQLHCSLGAKTSCGLVSTSHFVSENHRYEKQLC